MLKLLASGPKKTKPRSSAKRFKAKLSLHEYRAVSYKQHKVQKINQLKLSFLTTRE